MIQNTILDLFKKYNLLEESAVLPKDLSDQNYTVEINTLVEDILFEFLEDKAILYGDPTGGWDAGDLVGEYSHIIEDYVAASGGKVLIENFKIINPIDKDGDDDPDGEITIEFIHNDKKYHWVFSMEDPDTYYRDITYWAYDALNGNVLFLGEDLFCAFYLPKELIAELSDLGFESNLDYFGKKYDESYIQGINCSETWNKAIEKLKAISPRLEVTYSNSIVRKILSSDSFEIYRNSIFAYWDDDDDLLTISKIIPTEEDDPCVRISEFSSEKEINKSIVLLIYSDAEYFDDSMHIVNPDSIPDFDKVVCALKKLIERL